MNHRHRMISLHQTILSMVMILFMFTPLLIIKSLLALKLMSKALLSYLKVKWKGYDFSEDSWEPYINVTRTDCFDDYVRNNDKFRLLLLSNKYKKLNSSYSSRFPRVLSSIVRSLEREVI